MRKMHKLTAVMMASLIFTTAIPQNVFAQPENTAKEEVVYINLEADGTVKEINVVNIFDMKQAGTILDYGKYESLRNMTTTDEIAYENEEIVIETEAGKLYYEGKMESAEMPWLISLRYYIEGTEYTPEEVAGMRGKLKIVFSVKKNPACEGNFFEGYALQASMKLDTEICKNIVAEGATMANVGSIKQMTYMILPNKEPEFVITADVENFQMPAVAINGIRMNLNIDIDESTFQDKIGMITDAVGQLDAGAGKLNSGTAELFNATGKLNEGVGLLHEGVGKLNTGAGKLTDGLKEIDSNSDALTDGAMQAFKAICGAAQTQLNAKLEENGLETVELTPSNYKTVLEKLLKQLDIDGIYETAYQIALEKVTAEVEARAEEVYKGYLETQADSVYETYIRSQADEIYKMVVKDKVIENLKNEGYSQEDAESYLETTMGQIVFAMAMSSLTEEQKAQIIAGALESLTEDQKAQILDGALATLTEDQKKQIRDGYIDQVMKSEEVTSQINAAVEAAGPAAKQIADLKKQLDDYQRFYDGLLQYTDAVGTALDGSKELKDGTATLYDNTGTLTSSVGQLHGAVGQLHDGTGQLQSGTSEFAGRTEGLDTQVSDMITSMTASITGSDVETKSFTDERNTNVKAVQFVLQTEAIEIPEEVVTVTEDPKTMTFFEKMLKLFKF